LATSYLMGVNLTLTILRFRQITLGTENTDRQTDRKVIFCTDGSMKNLSHPLNLSISQISKVLLITKGS